MGYQLRPGLHFCQAGDGFIFLDLVGDRYFRLPETLEMHFRNLIDNPLAGGAPPELIRAGILQSATFRQTLSRPTLAPADMDSSGLGACERSFLEMGRAVAAEMLIARRLRSGRLAALIASYSRSKIGCDHMMAIDDPRPRQIIRAYEVAKLVRSPANRCLSRSIAMARRLAGCGCDIRLVIGVRADPFTAHCWVQAGRMVLNDTPDEVARYTPILVS